MILMFRVADTHNVRTTGYRIQIHLILYYELASYSVLHTWRLTFRVADTHDVLTLGYSTWVYCMLHRIHNHSIIILYITSVGLDTPVPYCGMPWLLTSYR